MKNQIYIHLYAWEFFSSENQNRFFFWILNNFYVLSRWCHRCWSCLSTYCYFACYRIYLHDHKNTPPATSPSPNYQQTYLSQFEGFVGNLGSEAWQVVCSCEHVSKSGNKQNNNNYWDNSNSNAYIMGIFLLRKSKQKFLEF